MDSSPEVVFAMVSGVPMHTIPKDLYIPPDALEVCLETFSGPLDLLLYLIRHQNIDILDIPMLTITQQYIAYIEAVQWQRSVLAADYLVMAALLAEIKSRLLLPVKPDTALHIEDDPRMVLVRRLKQYEQFKRAAQYLDTLPRRDRDHVLVSVRVDMMPVQKPLPHLTLETILAAMRGVLKRQTQQLHHAISREHLSVQARMVSILQYLQTQPVLAFSEMWAPCEGREGVVVSLLAILELAKQTLLVITQEHAFSPFRFPE
jgi:segregation and condensation protein A